MARRESGVTLLELLIVVAIAGAMATLVLPAFSSGLDNLRLSQAADSAAAFLNGALNRAERRQQVVELDILPQQNALAIRSADNSFARKLELPDGVRIEGEPRQVMLLPGSTFPRLGLQLANRRGQRRVVMIDPITGVPNISTP